jgi:hypothetical protein
MQVEHSELRVGPLALSVAIGADKRVQNVLSALTRDLPRFSDMPELALTTLGRCAILSGGPSLAGQVQDAKQFSTIFACGSAYEYAVSRGVTPTYCVVFDPSPEQARFFRGPHPATTFLVASCCDPAVFDALAAADVRLWHALDDLPAELFGHDARVGGGSSVTLRAIPLAHAMGFREQHLFGFDCCLMDGAEHAYPHAQDRPPAVGVSFNGRQFTTTPPLLQQAQEFCRMFNDHQHSLACVVYGDGLGAMMFREAARVTMGAAPCLNG